MNKKGSRKIQLLIMLALMLISMTGVCYANPVHFTPIQTVFLSMYWIMAPITAFLIAAGLFLLVRRLFTIKEQVSYSLGDQFYVIGFICLGYITCGFLIGFWFYWQALKEARDIYRTEFGPREGELVGRSRRIHLLLAVVLAALAYYLISIDPEWCMEYFEPAMAGWAILVSLTELATGDAFAESIGISVNISILLAVIWSGFFIFLLCVRKMRGKELKGAAVDGITVYLYILLGHFTLWLLAGAWFYWKAGRLGRQLCEDRMDDGRKAVE